MGRVDDEVVRGQDAERLPSGRHRLSRSYVASNQRGRILQAVIEVVGATGYGHFTIDAIVTRSAISKKTFYEHFRNKDEAFLAAYDSVTARLIEGVSAAMDEHESPKARMCAGLRALLVFLAAEPLAARMCVVEVLAAGREAIERRDRVKAYFSEMIITHLRALRPGCPEPGLTAEVIVGGVHEVLYSRISRDETHVLPGLERGLVGMFVLPKPPGEDHQDEAAPSAPPKA
ncbi:TetR/AcrR family transcriptional regulator [Actinomadura fibrosa]|uniref:TetR/AcrR family transcriptional regulator n=1 Tax=Actinomadura fibrosa TaxID=111802 RepID=A0ABW2XLA6_9ACTN|nr:TetR/AcrR family transcriptional regulator [Actinomadura fibrosa]